MKQGWTTTEFLALPAVLTVMVESPEIAWQVAVCYVAYAGARAVVKALGLEWSTPLEESK